MRADYPGPEFGLQMGLVPLGRDPESGLWEFAHLASGAPPELEAEPGDEPAATPPPAAVTPEHSQALLDTLERLAGDDVRIEDTGIEWRIMGVDDDSNEADNATGRANLDEVLDNAPTPIDEDLTSDSNTAAIDAADIFESAADELRFDDNTGLPDDFDYDAPTPRRAAPPRPEPEPESEPERAHTDTHVDIAFGDPEEWGALLGEVVDEIPVVTEVASADDDPDDSYDSREFEDATEPELVADDDDGPGDSLDDELAQMNALLSEVEAVTSGEIERELEETRRRLEDSSIDEDLMAAAFETERLALEEDDDEHALAADDSNEDNELDADGEVDPDLDVALDFDDSIALDIDSLSDEDVRLKMAFDAANQEDEPQETDHDEPDAAQHDDVEAPQALEELEEAVEIIDDEKPKHEVPEQSEEEETINRMIDEGLLSLAYEDEDGFTSTMNIDEAAAKQAVAAEEAAATAGPEEDGIAAAAEFDDTDVDDSVGGETIVMEGDTVRIALGNDEVDDKDPAADREINRLKAALKADAEAEAAATKRSGLPRLAAGVAALAVLLVLQGVHFSRAALATVPGVGDVVASVYDSIGLPITPNWDATGWRFEATDHSIEQSNSAGEAADSGGADGRALLTIYSRIGNQSGQALPYPLISVSLTDRFEETMGNKVLEPAEYLAQRVDTGALVAPGDTFNAVISIDSPTAEATGFRLSICYRQSGSRLRCAIGAYK